VAEPARRILNVNCGDDVACSCRQQENLGVFARNRGVAPHSFRYNIAAIETRTEQYQGREHLVVPVVMARSGVVMNGALVTEDEFFPEAWNGVPVTVGHPESAQDGGFTAANDPRVLETWAVGQIFNARVEDHALKGEAWIDVAAANRIRPTLIDELTSAASMDVSTGYFSKDEKRHGTSNGRQYQRVSRDLLPDHLALLPGDTGACSWEDGCGIRVNREGSSMKDKITAALATLGEAITGQRNERGEDDDHRQMVADLISNDKSPYTPSDMEALSYMSTDALIKTRDAFIPKAAPKAKKNQEAEGAQPVTTDNPGAAGLPATADELNKLVANSVAEALKIALPAALAETTKTITANSLTAEDRTALATAARITAEHKTTLVSKITANSAITKEQAEAMPLEQLEIVANGLRPATDYSGRPAPVVNSLDDNDPAVLAMVPPSVDDVIKANRKLVN